jgi:GDPmannose 4,6-dehydratase
VGLNYKNHIEIDKSLIRPAEVETLLANSTKAKKKLKWKPTVNFNDLVKEMVDHDLKLITSNKL